MKKSVIYGLLLFFLLVACKGKNKEQYEKAKAEKEIAETESLLYETEEPNAELAKKIIGLYVAYADKYVDSENTPKYLFKASEIAMNFNQPNNSIRYLTRIEENYPKFDKYPEVIFLKAFVYENYLKQLDKAEFYYKKFLEEYPDHKLAESAKSALMFLGMTDEQLIELFTEMNRYNKK
ncbi:MAG: tetratricopeptide repeat protein [Bacteroidales bacterium]|jgi:tetratricopeptide (TPR) repeat protein|nr:tetratricopeptide repeat protein [Bacteroidales bacterium]HOL98054.1 tetratricopeptide repeat protein [Bacteroidales bacterium]HOM37111.1 tetratricopeptide repeat protein [Bacteroidales bacterium]HPD23640.1 tetratricopeptide repeat protein [Bacteroidales bacterium]HRS99661.1 tetratricopeptide repeat protein [Bacteroidales bacterium]